VTGKYFKTNGKPNLKYIRIFIETKWNSCFPELHTFEGIKIRWIKFMVSSFIILKIRNQLIYHQNKQFKINENFMMNKLGRNKKTERR
jgi:hypothetical protein